MKLFVILCGFTSIDNRLVLMVICRTSCGGGWLVMYRNGCNIVHLG